MERKEEARSLAARRFPVAGRIPFQQALVRDQQARQRAQDRIETVIGFMGQRCQGKSRLDQALAGGVRGGCQMLAGPHLARLSQNLKQGGQGGRDQEDAKHRQGPEPGRRKRRPTKQEKQRQSGWHQAAAQVVE